MILHMRWKLEEVHTHVGVHLPLAVDVQFFIWIDRHQQGSNVGLQKKTREEASVSLCTCDNKGFLSCSHL